MKKIILNALFLVALGSSLSMHAQQACLVGTLFPATTFGDIPCDGSYYEITNDGYAGEYSNVTVTAGNTYTFATSVYTDYITIGSEDGTTVLAYGDGAAFITWTSDRTGVVRFYVHLEEDCSTEAVGRLKYIMCGAQPFDECTSAGTSTLFWNEVKSGSFGNASTSAAPAPSCQNNSMNDVWYEITADQIGNLTISTLPALTGPPVDTIITAFQGDCGALVEVGCNDDFNNTLYSQLSLTGLVPSSNVIVRISRYSLGTLGDGNFLVLADNPLAATTFEANNFKAYPNPIKNVLNLSFDKNISNVAVFNLLGQEVITKQINANQTQIDFSNLATGNYFVKVTADNQVKTIKVIKE